MLCILSFEEIMAYLMETRLLSLDEINEIFASMTIVSAFGARNITCCATPRIYNIHESINRLPIWVRYCWECITIYK